MLNQNACCTTISALLLVAGILIYSIDPEKFILDQTSSERRK